MRFTGLSKTIDASKKQEILDAAQKVFAEVGFKEATVRQICKLAKANVCLVSYYFDGKEGLYRSIIERMATERVPTFHEIIKIGSDIETEDEYRTRLKLFLEQIHGHMSQNIDFMRIMQREVQEGIPRLEERVLGFIRMTRQKFVDFIAYGQRKKFIRKDLDPVIVAATAINAIMGFVQQQSLNRNDVFFPGVPQDQIPERVVKTVTTLFFDGVRP